MENVNVYRMGDGSFLCRDCLTNYLLECGEPNNITGGQQTDENNIPVYGWTKGQCSDCN